MMSPDQQPRRPDPPHEADVESAPSGSKSDDEPEKTNWVQMSNYAELAVVSPPLLSSDGSSASVSTTGCTQRGSTLSDFLWALRPDSCNSSGRHQRMFRCHPELSEGPVSFAV